MLRMLFRIFFKAGLASSAISSSEMMQRRISSKSGVSGSMPSKRSSRESRAPSSDFPREKALTRFAASSRELSAKNSSMPIVPPISRRFKEASISWIPEKETLPFWKSLVSASAVWVCAASIFALSVIGFKERQSSFAFGDAACSVRRSMILLYSNVLNAFSFI